MAEQLLDRIEGLGAKLAEAKGSINRRFIGQERVVDLVLASMLCGGHALLVGLPGLGKTRLVDTLSTVMGLVYYQDVVAAGLDAHARASMRTAS